MRFAKQFFVALLVMLLVSAPARAGVASEAAEHLGRQVTKSLGREAVEFGGERATRELAERLLREGGQESLATLQRIARAGEASSVRALRNVAGRTLRHLDDVPEAELVRAVGTLARPGVADGWTPLATDTLRSAALRAEMRLPGAGSSLVREFGDDGLVAAARLTDTQANQLLKPQQVQVVRRLAPQSKRALLDAITTRPDAQLQIVRTTGKTAATGVAVIAGGTVLWHATDVALAPTETTVTHTDGTVTRTKTSVGAQAAALAPQVTEKLVPAITWTGVALAAGLTLIGYRRFARRA